MKIAIQVLLILLALITSLGGIAEKDDKLRESIRFSAIIFWVLVVITLII